MSYFSGDLHKLLIRKGATEEVAERVVNEMQELGYLDDQAWVNSYIRRQLAGKKGGRDIQQQLRQRGVRSELFEGRMPSEEEEREAVDLLLQTRYRNRNLDDPKERMKVKAALARRGFSFDTIDSVFRR